MPSDAVRSAPVTLLGAMCYSSPGPPCPGGLLVGFVAGQTQGQHAGLRGGRLLFWGKNQNAPLAPLRQANAYKHFAFLGKADFRSLSLSWLRPENGRPCQEKDFNFCLW